MRWFLNHIKKLNERGKLTARVSEPLPRSLAPSQRAIVALSSLGIGLFPIAPATAASAVTVLAVYLARDYFGRAHWLVATAGITVLGIWLGKAAQKTFGRSDPRSFILDEVAGQLLVFVFHGITGSTCLLGFALFRLFDILKLPPADCLEDLGGGWGIMADDLVAGLYASLVLYIIRAVVPLLG